MNIDTSCGMQIGIELQLFNLPPALFPLAPDGDILTHPRRYYQAFAPWPGMMVASLGLDEDPVPAITA